MSGNGFNTSAMAERYARRHLNTDPGIREIYYLPAEAPDREIRFVEVNELIAGRDSDPIEPVDFGVDTGSATAHKLIVVDVTPAQWDKIARNEITLPQGWTLSGAINFRRN